jgi:Permuted papain-like amidase enzyme, YaeF/YiiX, C92 family
MNNNFVWVLIHFLAILLISGCVNNGANLPDLANVQKDTLSDKDKNLLMHINNLSMPKVSKKAPRASISNVEISQLKQGDILLRRGYGAVSDFISDFLEETYPVTHCGFVLEYPDNKIYILHIISDLDSNGVRTESLETYVNQSQENSLAAVRLKATESQRQAILTEIYKLKSAGMKFDMGFNDHEPTEMYCAEMSRFVIQKVIKKDVLPDRAQKLGIDVTRMSNFFAPAHFDIIFNQLPTQ